MSTEQKTYRVMLKRKPVTIFEGTLDEVSAWLDTNGTWEYTGTDGSFERRKAWRLPWKDIKQDVEVCSLQRRAASLETATHAMVWSPDNDVRHLTHRQSP